MATKKSVLVFATLVQTSCSHDLSLVSYTFLRAIDVVSTFDLLFAEIKSILMTKSEASSIVGLRLALDCCLLL